MLVADTPGPPLTDGVVAGAQFPIVFLSLVTEPPPPGAPRQVQRRFGTHRIASKRSCSHQGAFVVELPGEQGGELRCHGRPLCTGGALLRRLPRPLGVRTRWSLFDPRGGTRSTSSLCEQERPQPRWYGTGERRGTYTEVRKRWNTSRRLPVNIPNTAVSTAFILSPHRHRFRSLFRADVSVLLAGEVSRRGRSLRWLRATSVAMPELGTVQGQ